ncbi:hypothetical protein [Streptomyces sp. NPDC017086]|uniref:hypothetical protein n=1 Tax=Streptomyces sp. NPDC017086 TaxID=3364976 RepID=UPI0037926B23
MAEEVLRHTGERPDSLPVKPEDAVCADEVDAEETVPCVLDAVCCRVRNAGEGPLPLSFRQIRGLKSVACFRSLDEGVTLRHHFRHTDEEGGLWYFAAVPDRGKLIAIKQAELTPADQLHRYNWGAPGTSTAP